MSVGTIEKEDKRKKGGNRRQQGGGEERGGKLRENKKMLRESTRGCAARLNLMSSVFIDE